MKTIPERTDITKEIGKDPCAVQLYPEETIKDRQGICPRDERNLVIRWVIFVLLCIRGFAVLLDPLFPGASMKPAFALPSTTTLKMLVF